MGSLDPPAKHAEVPEPMPQELAATVEYWLARYNRNTSEAARHLRDLAGKDPELCVDTLAKLHHSGNGMGAASFLARLLGDVGAVAARICNPTASIEDSVRLARTWAQYDPHFDVRFAKKLLEDDQMAEATRQRGLAVLEKLNSRGRLAPILIQFLRNPDSRIRSKAALMLGQTMPSPGIMDRLMGDGNARVRANFIEGLWNYSAIDFRPLFRMALRDPDHRVAGNALVGLYLLGETHDVGTPLEQMARHSEAPFRAAAAWVMGQTRDERFIGLLRDMAGDPYRVVRSSALRALGRISRLPPAAGPPGDVAVQIPPEVN